MLLWYNIVMEKFENKIKSNTEMVTISRAEYETLQTKLKDTQAELENTPKEAILLPGSFASATAIAHILNMLFIRHCIVWNRNLDEWGLNFQGKRCQIGY